MNFLSAQVLKNTLATLGGEHQVEDDRIINTLFGKMGTRFTVGGVIDSQSCFAQGSNDVFGKTSLILNKQYPHD
jgi:hypothetical protein